MTRPTDGRKPFAGSSAQIRASIACPRNATSAWENGILSPAAWTGLCHAADRAAVWCLTIAMAAVGLATGLAKLTRLGIKPLSVGFAAAVLVGAVSAILIKTLGPLML